MLCYRYTSMSKMGTPRLQLGKNRGTIIVEARLIKDTEINVWGVKQAGNLLQRLSM